MASVQQFSSLPPLSLYVHIPWCVKKCPYCDFNSHTSNKGLPEKEYVSALLKDFEKDLAHAQGRPLRSIFFGGGTPSLFSAAAISDLLSHFETKLNFESDIEITLEANPGTVEQKKFEGFRAVGINRLSLGIQSFNDGFLRKLGRIHNADEAIKATEAAINSGYNSFNLDLMHGLPEQSPQQALQDLQQAIELSPQHLSWYQLTIEPNTAFYKNPPQLPTDDTLASVEEQGSALLVSEGYAQYEISAFSKEDARSKHNINYWEFGDYLGIGAGAHSKVTSLERQQVLRGQKTRMPQRYIDTSEDSTNHWMPVDPEQLILEFMMNGLRLRHGVPASHFSHRTGLAIEQIESTLEAARDSGLLEKGQQQLRATPLGRKFLNNLLDQFVPALNK